MLAAAVRMTTHPGKEKPLSTQPPFCERRPELRHNVGHVLYHNKESVATSPGVRAVYHRVRRFGFEGEGNGGVLPRKNLNEETPP